MVNKTLLKLIQILVMEKFSYTIINKAGIQHIIQKEGIWMIKDHRQKYHQFLNPFENKDKITKAESSLSGNFVAMIVNGKLHLLTLTNDSLYAEFLDQENNFVDVCFSNQETRIFALASNKFILFRTLPPAKMQEFVFCSEYPAISFSLSESQMYLTVRVQTEESIEQMYFQLPEQFERNEIDPIELQPVEEADTVVFNPYSFPSSDEGDFDDNDQNMIQEISENNSEESRRIENKACALLENCAQLEMYQKRLDSRLERIEQRKNAVLEKNAILRKRFINSQIQFAHHFRRIQKLIELKDKGCKIDKLFRTYESSNATLNSISFPSLEVEDDVILEFMRQQFHDRLGHLERDVECILENVQPE
ncbi:hypothetical protein TRFO_19121 [Tritrichomonas foetus]|uniref:Uncharacterized protein n=1 Tax=Tritrichomonas foetus TaxID=1144522 RepID=A0A1J4KK24_9EUKA|nr:hypothetical protein TRFO_19121 [Tritrichomonas foetus]|eukprot:OHT11474.1 hypothetical protein TRFO_19121 [Tritrichomonas foetus]